MRTYRFSDRDRKNRLAGSNGVNKGPLRKAQENICAYKMEEQIETRLSDGFSALKVQEVQSAVIAGWVEIL